MKTNRREIKRQRLIKLIDERFGGKQVAFAEKVDLPANLISRYVRGVKGIGEDMQLRMEHACDLVPNWFDGDDESHALTQEQKHLLLLSENMDAETREAWVKVGASLTKHAANVALDAVTEQADNTPPPTCVCRKHPQKKPSR